MASDIVMKQGREVWHKHALCFDPIEPVATCKRHGARRSYLKSALFLRSLSVPSPSVDEGMHVDAVGYISHVFRGEGSKRENLVWIARTYCCDAGGKVGECQVNLCVSYSHTSCKYLVC